MGARIGVKVRVAASDADGVRKTAAALAAAGMTVRHQLPELGLVTGDVEISAIAALAQIDGVISAEPEGSVELPPFDSSTPQ